jgi:hypothetical protein
MPMCIYSCRLQNRDGSSDDFDLGDFGDEQTAIHAARTALLVSLCGKQVEIWRDRDLVVRIGRDVAQFRNRAPPFPIARAG